MCTANRASLPEHGIDMRQQQGLSRHLYNSCAGQPDCRQPILHPVRILSQRMLPDICTSRASFLRGASSASYCCRTDCIVIAHLVTSGGHTQAHMVEVCHCRHRFPTHRMVHANANSGNYQPAHLISQTPLHRAARTTSALVNHGVRSEPTLWSDPCTMYMNTRRLSGNSCCVTTASLS
jgi:hypothetical protein